MRRLVAVWLCLVLASAAMVMTTDVDDNVEGSGNEGKSQAYIVSEPFRINSNADFAASPKVSGGNGSFDNPWIIENFNISGRGTGYCIYIGNTTECFVVKNSNLHGAMSGFISEAWGDWYAGSYDDSAIYLNNVSNGCLFNLSVSDNYNGAYLISSNNISIQNSSFDNYAGIFFNSGDYNLIANNSITSDENIAIVIYSSHNMIINNTISESLISLSSSNNTILNNTIIDGGISCWGWGVEDWNTHTINTGNTVNGRPVYYWKNQVGGSIPIDAGQTILANCTNVRIEGLNISDSAGIFIGYSLNVTLKDNLVNSNAYSGISITNTDNCSIISNNISSNGGYGIGFDYSSEILIKNNSILSNNEDGINFWNCNNNTIEQNNISFNERCAIEVSGSNSNFKIRKNTIISSGDGITIDSTNWTIEDNTISSGMNGISIDDFHISESNVISNNTISAWGSGIDLGRSTAIITNNSISGYLTYFGIMISDTKNTTLISNTIMSRQGKGIAMGSALNASLFDNKMMNCSIFVSGTEVRHWNSHTIDNDNSINGKSVQYLKDQNNATVPSGAGQIILANCTEIMVINQNLSNCGIGLAVAFSSEIMARNITALSDMVGISYYMTRNSTITECNTSKNVRGFNIYDCYNITIAQNKVCGNNRYMTFEYNIGIWLRDSSDNHITDNFISNNTGSVFGRAGIMLDLGSYNNTINRNNIQSNDHGIEIINCQNNSIFHNNFINNTVHASDTGDNFWNSTYPKGGNYWSGCNGTDAYFGPLQDQYGSDGIGDMFHNYSGIVDYYPLMGTWFLDSEYPMAVAGYNQTVRMDSNITFNASESNDNVGIVNYTWQISDGTNDLTYYGVSFSRHYGIPGKFSVLLNVADSAGNLDTDKIVITVLETTAPMAAAGPDRNATIGLPITFDGSGSTDNVGIVNYSWTFAHNGTAVSLYGVSPSFTFWEEGIHTVTLTVSDAAGNTGTDTMVVSVVPPPAEPRSILLPMLLATALAAIGAFLIFQFLRRGKTKPVDAAPPTDSGSA